jgi:hypothetical protein
MIDQIRHVQSESPFQTFAIELASGRVIQIHDRHQVATTEGARHGEDVIGVLYHRGGFELINGSQIASVSVGVHPKAKAEAKKRFEGRPEEPGPLPPNPNLSGTLTVRLPQHLGNLPLSASEISARAGQERAASNLRRRVSRREAVQRRLLRIRGSGEVFIAFSIQGWVHCQIVDVVGRSHSRRPRRRRGFSTRKDAAKMDIPRWLRRA